MRQCLLSCCKNNTHETPFNLPNVAVYLALKQKANLIHVLPVKVLTKKLVFFTSYDCNWQPYKEDFMGICYFYLQFFVSHLLKWKFYLYYLTWKYSFLSIQTLHSKNVRIQMRKALLHYNSKDNWFIQVYMNYILHHLHLPYDINCYAERERRYYL